jgi:hypothetical protein
LTVDSPTFNLSNGEPEAVPEQATQPVKTTVAVIVSPELAQVPTIPVLPDNVREETVTAPEAPAVLALLYWSAVTVTPLSIIKLPPDSTVMPFKC